MIRTVVLIHLSIMNLPKCGHEKNNFINDFFRKMIALSKDEDAMSTSIFNDSEAADTAVSHINGYVPIWGTKANLKYVNADAIAPIRQQLHSIFAREESTEGAYKVSFTSNIYISSWQNCSEKIGSE